MTRLFVGLVLLVVGAFCLHQGARGQLPGSFAPVSVGVSGGVACTPNTQGGGADANVWALLHFDNNGTDNAPIPHNLTLNGGAAYSTVQSKFGGYSLSIPTAGTSFAQQAAGMLGGAGGIGSGDLTLEAWIWLGSSPSLFAAIGDDQATNISMGGNPNLFQQIAGTSITFTPQMPAAISANAWHHIAITRASGTGAGAYYVDGVAQAGGATAAGGVFGNATSGLKFGRGYSASYVMPSGSYMDEARISNVIRYTANFTPAVLPFCNPVPPAPSANYRYWRMDITAIGGGSWAQIAEWTMNSGGVNQIPAMTGTTTSGVTITSPGTQGAGWEEFRAADRVPSTFWYSGPSGATYLKLDFGAGNAKHIDNYTIQASPGAIAPAAWTLKGSNDDAIYFNVDTQSGQTWTAGQIRSYTPAAYGGAPSTAPTALLHLDGTNGSTTITDSSGNNTSWSRAIGTGTIDTSQFKFGTASYHSTNSDQVTGNGDARLAFGTGDFTVDFWIRPTGTNQANLFTWGGLALGKTIYLAPSTQILKVFDYGTTTDVITGTTAVTLNAWHHVAATRTGGNLRIFLDGVQQGATLTDTTNYIIAATEPYFGNTTTNYSLAGWIDEVRIVVGYSAWSANFTPPTVPY